MKTLKNFDVVNFEYDADEEQESEGLHVIFVRNKESIYMGKVIALSGESVLILPWNFLMGGLDTDQPTELQLDDFDNFHSFPNADSMDAFHAKHYWKDVLQTKGKTK